MWALTVATIYFGTFLAIGWMAKRVIDHWMDHRAVGLDEVHTQAGGAASAPFSSGRLA